MDYIVYWNMMQKVIHLILHQLNLNEINDELIVTP
jgi:hypothetical protein